MTGLNSHNAFVHTSGRRTIWFWVDFFLQYKISTCYYNLKWQLKNYIIKKQKNAPCDPMSNKTVAMVRCEQYWFLSNLQTLKVSRKVKRQKRHRRVCMAGCLFSTFSSPAETLTKLLASRELLQMLHCNIALVYTRAIHTIQFKHGKLSYAFTPNRTSK